MAAARGCIVQIRKAPFSSYAVWLGGLLAVAGLVVLLGYGAYYFTTSFFGSTGVPLGVQFAVAALLVGTLVIIVAAIIDRRRQRVVESFKEVEF
jgi:uncharacterized membrane protein (DUF485 family)